MEPALTGSEAGVDPSVSQPIAQVDSGMGATGVPSRPSAVEPGDAGSGMSADGGSELPSDGGIPALADGGSAYLIDGGFPGESSDAGVLPDAGEGTAVPDAGGLSDAGSDDRPWGDNPWRYGHVVETADSVPEGDPVVGRKTLLDGGYMGCGLPLSMWDDLVSGPVIREVFDWGEDLAIPREGRNASMPHYLSAFTARNGAEVVNFNCLTCHVGSVNGETVMGLGNANLDFTDGFFNGVPVEPEAAELVPFIDEAERENLRITARVASFVREDVVMRTVGQNPAQMLVHYLLAHRDPTTLTLADTLLRPIDPVDEYGDVVPDGRLVMDVPPWWNLAKKTSAFCNAAGRGDLRGTMALATMVCLEDPADAEDVLEQFIDVQAYLLTLRAPRYPWSIDRELAALGKPLFQANCAGCHGTYGEDPADDAGDTYPHLLIPLEVIGTDSVMAQYGNFHGPQLSAAHNRSPYGRVTPLDYDDPFPGYVAPPLDGVWATAPYLHNGSVPTIELVLNSRARPAVWKREDYDNSHYDQDALGWPYEAKDYRQSEAPFFERPLLYDTGHWSQSNAGHPFGDHLTDGERRAVLEYLKTL